jgi:hypothetical protein
MADSDEEEAGDAIEYYQDYACLDIIKRHDHMKFRNPCNQDCLVKAMCTNWCDERYKYRNFMVWKNDTIKYIKRLLTPPSKIVFSLFELILFLIIGIAAGLVFVFGLGVIAVIIQAVFKAFLL